MSPEQLQHREAMTVKERFNERLVQRYQASMKRNALAVNVAQKQEFDARMKKRDASFDATERAFKATPFDKLKLVNLKVENPALVQMQQRVTALAERGVSMQEAFATNGNANRAETFKIFLSEVGSCREALNALKKSPAATDDPAAVRQMEEVLQQYEKIIPGTLFYEREMTPGEKNVDARVGTAFRLVAATLGTAYTAYAALCGWKTGNWFPAIGGAGVTAAAIFGTKRLFEGSGDAVVRQTEFLASNEYKSFFKRTKISGKEWAKAVEEMQSHGPELKAVRDERDPKARLEKLKAIGLSKAAEALVSRLVNTPGDFAMLVRVCTEGNEEANGVIVRYIEKGAPAQAFTMVKNPQTIPQYN